MNLLIDDTLLEDGRTVVLGISGGADSVCLLHELMAMDAVRRDAGGCGNPIVCAHVNHGLRGAESCGDEAFVSGLCAKCGVDFEVLRINAGELANQSGWTVEEAGREARYAFFDELCEKRKGSGEPPVIAVAHNMDDQAETVLMRMFRGTGVDGLAGMAPARKSAAGFCIVRPLLRVSRENIYERLREYGAEFRQDASNADDTYFRNRIRLAAIPYLEETIAANLKQSLVRMAENAAEDKAFFDAVVNETLDEYLEYPNLPEHTDSSGAGAGAQSLRDSIDGHGQTGGVCTLPAELLANVHPAIRHRIIRAVFAELGLVRDIAYVHLAAADRLMETFVTGGEASGKRVEFPADYTFGIARKNAVFRAPDAADPSWRPRRKR